MVADTEQRKYIRVPFKTAVCLWSLKQDAKEIRCDQTRDISLKGLYCYSDIKFSTGTPCELELHLTGTSSKLVLFFKGRVVRTDEKGMGIRFEEMDLDSFLLLKNILNYNTGDPEKIDQELIGYIHKE
ncbi:MAG: PilZ domain-containing protein [Deltaproteobacteria bacterium]|nr:PilZ domain-containing protein [Deltaproteobacteria bacterium]